MGKVSLYQLSNAGFAVKAPDSLWLVDALHDGAGQYEGTSPAALALIRRLAAEIRPPVRLLVTHLHPDHIGARAVRSLTAEMPLAVYAADPEILGMNLGPAEVALLPLDANHFIGKDRIRAMALPHLSPQQFNILHTALRVDIEGVSLFISGDGMMDERIYARNAAYIQAVDAAVCLYSYAFTRRNLAFVKAHIDPGELVVNHFPDPGQDAHDSLNRFKAFSLKENQGMRITPFARTGDSLSV